MNKSLNKIYESFIEFTGVNNQKELATYINNNGFEKYAPKELQAFSELLNTSKNEHAAYYTSEELVTKMVTSLPSFTKKQHLRILEPSVGSGCFILALIQKYSKKKSLVIDVIDINIDSLNILKAILETSNLPKNIEINYICGDFLKEKLNCHYDLAIGNPPFKKIISSDINFKTYKENAINKKTNNIFSFFLEKVTQHAEYVSFIVPKSILGAPEFNQSRNDLKSKKFTDIFDFGVKAFKGVLIETVGLCFYTEHTSEGNNITIHSGITLETFVLPQNYVMADRYPTWLIYRNDFFDMVAEKLSFGEFEVFRDRQISSKMLIPNGEYRVLKAENIGNAELVDISEKRFFINDIKKLSVAKFLDSESLVLVPNLSYLPRACLKPKNTIVDGSAAILIKKNNKKISTNQLLYFSSDEFRKFYKICRNFSTRSMNIDSNYVFYFGLSHE